MKTKLARIIGDMMERKELTQTSLVDEAGCPIGNRHRLARLMGGQTVASGEEQDWLRKRLSDETLFGTDDRAVPIAPTLLAWYRTEDARYKLTLTEMARKAGLDLETYQSTENGEYAPTEEAQKRIAKALGRSLFDVFDKRGYACVDIALIDARQESHRDTAPAVAAG